MTYRKMSSVHYLRDLISQRLTAAAQEIFTEFEKITVRYEEEIDRQRKLLETSETLQMWIPKIKLHKIDFPQQHDFEEKEALADQGVCNQEESSSFNQEDPEKLCTTQQGELPVLKQEGDTIAVSPVDEQRDHSETDSMSEQLLPLSSPQAESRDELGSKPVDSETINCLELKVETTHDGFQNHANNEENDHNSHCDFDKAKNYIKCDVCGKTFLKRYQLNRHCKIHTGERPYTCTVCHKSFLFNWRLNHHMISHTGEGPFSCKTCGKNFTLRNSLSAHFKHHHTTGAHYFCEKCGREFSQRSGLMKHVKIHTDVKPYCCEICGKSFLYKVSLSNHLNTHTKQRPYSCETCGKSFANSSNLVVHKRIHTGHRPYSCNVCGKSFSHRSSIKCHMKTHQGQKV
ncbi:uncharacterized protein PAE49_017136 [Odontesthes bonariensis]|uniref:uncharacterized protein LOC142400787 n=1 Tax=Odontesthes bonariensis TaxID=219752 RepID=UPI003F58D50E